MATVINNPPGSGRSDGGGGAGIIIGVIIAIILFVLFIVFGLPALRSVPSSNQGGETNIQIPDKFDINVQTPKGNGG